jgi:protein-L-isoaspartate O-methyltransferase
VNGGACALRLGSARVGTAAGQPGEFWEKAAEGGEVWYLATGHRQESEEFFRQGAGETDTFLAFCGVEPGPQLSVLEVGSGVGRMTRRLAELFGHVVAVDVSEQMLRRCRENLASFDNVEYRLVPGDGTLGETGEAEVDVVFSYVTFQHVPTKSAQLRYFDNCARALRPGGQIAVQIRSPSLGAVALTYAAGLAHFLLGRRTLSRSWRGSRVAPEEVIGRLAAEGVVATVRPWPHRPWWSPAHLWVVGRKPGPRS